MHFTDLEIEADSTALKGQCREIFYPFFCSKHSTWVPYERAIELYCFRKMGNFCLKPCSYGARWCVLKIIIRVKISWFCPFTGIPVGLPYFFNMSEIYLRKKVTDYGRLVGTYIGYRYRIFYQVLPVDVAPVELEIPELVQHIQVLIQSIWSTWYSRCSLFSKPNKFDQT